MTQQTTLAEAVAEKKARISSKLAITVAREIETKGKELDESRAAAKKEYETTVDRLSRRTEGLAGLSQQLEVAFQDSNIDEIKAIRSKISTVGLTDEELRARHDPFGMRFYMAGGR